MKKKTSFTSVGCKSILSLLVAFALTACGSDSSSKSEETKDNLNQDYDNSDQDTIVKNASISGAALKGPFKFDSPLELHELLLVNDTLSYSGNDYIDEISSNKGDFVIPRVNLISPYAELVVEGLWHNEVSGQWSSEPLKLRALVDLNERTEVNINLLTDLEYDRVVKLVNKGYSVLAAKKQAEFEIMTAFGFATTIENAEDLKVFVDSADSKHDANATLMAISLLFLGDRDESAVVESINSFKSDFTPSGSWDNNQAKVEMADWAESFDNAVVRVNVKSWNILNIPKFETYLNIFWYNVYGLGGCAENRYGTIVKNSNDLSRNYDVHYICFDDQWRRATDYEKDTYQWTDGKENEIKKGDVTGADYIFRKGSWIAKNDDGDDESCDKTRSGEKITKDNRYYACENGIWKEIDENDYYVVRNISVTGSAQKGPFKFNSPLKIKEMHLRNDSLVYTDREFEDEISSNTGDFVVPKVSLAYPYATLEVRGLWRNEITGKWSSDSMTLRALTELSSNANINILTHLEYDRAVNLVKKGYSVSAAKTQADYEIMTAFAIIPTTSNSEEKLTFGEGADPTLLALAILFTGDRSDSEIQKTINSFKADIATDGVWNDEQTKAEMADYAENFNSSVVHTNVKSWNISVIPDFETQLATFWNNAYGLGGCASTRNGLVLQNNNSLSSNYGVHYICESNAWRRATDYEKDTYKWAKGTTGDVKKGNVTNTYYTYNGSKWVVADRENDIGLCKGSTGVIKEYGGTYYICRSKNWVEATALEYDTYGWTAGTDGEVRPGTVNTNKYYVYENGSWRASSGTVENNLGACVISRLGEVGKSGTTYYTCKTDGWVTSTALEYDTYGWTAGTEGEVRPGSVNTDKYYVYENGSWRVSAGTIENNLGACVMRRLGEVGKSGNSYYTCKTNGWETSTELEYDTYGWIAGTEGEVKSGSVNTDKYYVYADGAWRSSSGPVENNLGACVTSRLGEVDKLGTTYYTCKIDGWLTSTALEYDTYRWTAGTDGEVRTGSVNTDKYYVYDNGTWRASTGPLENNLGACVTSRLGEVGKWGDTYYTCKTNRWIPSSELEYDTYGMDCSSDKIGKIIDGLVNATNRYYCSANGWVILMGGWSWDVPKEARLSPTITYDTMTDSRDNKTYKTVKIGDQIWMAENLNYADSTKTPSLLMRSWCYNNIAANCDVAGRHYTWSAVIDSVKLYWKENVDCGYGKICSLPDTVHGICPLGWHLPTETEWKTLFAKVGGSLTAGKILKSQTGWNSNGNGTDGVGFSALPASDRSSNGDFTNDGNYAYFWGATDYSSNRACYINLLYSDDGAFLSSSPKSAGLSVRCVKD